MAVTEHPEVLRAAAREIELCLKALEPAGEDRDRAALDANTLPLKALATQPLAALALVYHCLDDHSREDFQRWVDRGYEEETAETISRLAAIPALRREARPVFAALAREIGQAQSIQGARRWPSRALAVLAWAATESGDHGQALRLCALAGPALESSDDLLFVQAVAQQRAAEWEPAIRSLRMLREKFPASPLNAGGTFRLATILRDRGEPGLAVRELLRLRRHGDEESEKLSASGLHAAGRDRGDRTCGATPAPARRDRPVGRHSAGVRTGRAARTRSERSA